MKYSELQNNLRDLGIFNLNDIRLIDPEFRDPTLTEWVDKGWVKRIRREWYADPGFQPYDNDLFYVANKIYAPSYISLESALNYYSFIPEAVQQITSVSTRKTASFSTEFAEFTYRSIKPEIYFGYEIIKYANRSVLIADPEKTLLDYLYLHNEITGIEDFEELRFNKERINSIIDDKKIRAYLDLFENEELKKRYNILMEYLNA